MDKNLDSLGVEKALQNFPEQLRSSWKNVYSQDFPTFNPGEVVISGMGGSALAGRIIVGLFEDKLKVPVFIHTDYELPKWVGRETQTLIIASSYSGNTEETLSGISKALEIGIPVLGLTTGGILGDKIQSGEIAGVIFSDETNPTRFPKTGLGLSLGALLGLLTKIKILSLTEEEFLNATSEVTSLRETFQSNEIAQWLQNYIPTIICARPLLGSLHAGRNAINEIGRTFAAFFDLPELDHHLIEATEWPAQAKELLRYLFFRTQFAHQRVLKRYQLTEELLTERGLTWKEVELRGSTTLVQALELPHLCAWVGFHLAILNGTDPGPEPWILKFKERLGKP